MFRKFQIALIRMISAGRPVLMNVHVSDKGVTVFGNHAHIEGCHIKVIKPDLGISIQGSKLPIFGMPESKHI